MEKREIKFRIWEKPGVLLSSSEGTTDFKGKMHLQDDWSFWGYALKRPEEYELMQLAHAKDKNHKDIYEGDVVQKGKMRYLIELRDGCFGIFTRHYGWECLSKWSNIEVIGNIYENPELFKAQKQRNYV
ncbi:MAG: YopX family protein [Acidobacteriia bacterium]|nr:YopX family protein [Terriglobia bacterium]